MTSFILNICNKQISNVLNKNRKVISYTPVRAYRNILHADEPNRPGSHIWPIFILSGFMFYIIDFKKWFGLHDEEQAMKDLENYTIPDVILTYSTKPGLKSSTKNETDQGKSVTTDQTKK